MGIRGVQWCPWSDGKLVAVNDVRKPKDRRKLPTRAVLRATNDHGTGAAGSVLNTGGDVGIDAAGFV